MSKRPPQPPEGKLIQTASKRSGLSARKAATIAGISEGRWRQIVNGYQVPSAGTHIKVTAPADTLARMASTVGVTPDQLSAAGRSDAAAELVALQHLDEGADPQPASSPSSSGATSNTVRVEIDLVGPVEGLLEGGERLTAWQMALGRQYRLEVPENGYAIEAVFGAHEQPEDVIDDLRQQLESTIALAQTQAKRRSGGRGARRP